MASRRAGSPPSPGPSTGPAARRFLPTLTRTSRHLAACASSRYTFTSGPRPLPGRLEQLARVARRVVQEDLLAPHPGHAVVAQVGARVAIANVGAGGMTSAKPSRPVWNPSAASTS